MIVSRPPLPTLRVALLLGLLTAFAAACGEEQEGLLTSGRAENLKEHLDAIDESVAAGRCARARARLDALRREIDELPESTDRRLRQRLETGHANLESQAPEECADGQTTETTPETTPEEQPTETLPSETTPPETTPPETTPPSEEVPSPEEETPPSDDGTPPGQQDDGTPGNSGGSQAPASFGVIRP